MFENQAVKVIKVEIFDLNLKGITHPFKIKIQWQNKQV